MLWQAKKELLGGPKFMTWNIEGKTALVTGGSSGIGFETVRGLAKLGCNVILTSRSGAKAREVAKSLTNDSARVEGLELDLTTPASIRTFVDEASKNLNKLDILINNAGLIAGKRVETPEGFEYTFAANYLGPYLLTRLMMSKLEATDGYRVINLSSELYRNAKRGLDFSDLQLKKGYSSSKAYANSKLATMLFTLELQNVLAGTTSRAFAVHPGVIRTNFGTGQNSSKSMALMMKLMGPLLKPAETGARTSLILASGSEEQLGNGWYWSEGVPKSPSEIATNKAASKRLWSVTEDLLGLA